MGDPCAGRLRLRSGPGGVDNATCPDIGMDLAVDSGRIKTEEPEVAHRSRLKAGRGQFGASNPPRAEEKTKSLLNVSTVIDSHEEEALHVCSSNRRWLVGRCKAILLLVGTVTLAAYAPAARAAELIGTLYNFEQESQFADWTAGIDEVVPYTPSTDYWGWVNDAGWQPPYVWCAGNTNGSSQMWSHYDNLMSAYMEKDFDLRGYENCYLQFDYFLSTADDNDKLIVYFDSRNVFEKDGNPQINWDPAVPPHLGYQQQISLEGYDDSIVTIRFRFTSDSSGNSCDQPGAFLDNIGVYGDPIDTTSPTVAISSPTAGQTFTTSPITVNGTASDPGTPSSGVALVEVRVNGGSWQTATGTASWSRSGVALSSGSNTIQARSKDNAGNYSSIASVTVTYDPPQPPQAAVNPVPSNQAFKIGLNPTLSWGNGGGATSYDVYFGPNTLPSSPASVNQSGTSFIPTGTLTPNTTYFWRVDAKNSSGTTTGNEWSFRTAVYVRLAFGIPATAAFPGASWRDWLPNADKTFKITPGSTSPANSCAEGPLDPQGGQQPQIVSELEQIYANSEIQNVVIQWGDETDPAEVVYFVPWEAHHVHTDGTPYRGLAYSVLNDGDLRWDRNNNDPRGEAVVFVQPEDTFVELALAAAHEVGHLFGMRHVGICAHDVIEVMKQGNLANPEFIMRFDDCKRDFDDDNPYEHSHNTFYYAKRWLDGVEPPGSEKGTWDEEPSGVAPLYEWRVSIDDPERTVYQVDVVANLQGLGLSDGIPLGGTVIAHYDAITLAELGQQGFVFPEGVVIQVYGATTPDGPMDCALSKGDPSQVQNLVFSVSEPEPVAFLQAADGNDSFVTLALASTSSIIIPEADCNGNGQRDYEDIRSGVSKDCNRNWVPDECETVPDSDGDGVADGCDLCPATIPGSPVDEDGCPPVIPGDFDRDGDVGPSDLDAFVSCISGPEVPLASGCEGKDLDDDGDVDQSDFGIFQRCLSGEDVPGDPNCAQTSPPGMVLIPAGEFQMGDTFNEGDSDGRELPVHTVRVDDFYMDKYEVTKELWDTVRAWGLSNGYSDLVAGGGKAPDHPVHSVNWYECVKWCNARSQMEGRTPCYYTDAGLATIYKTGQLAPHVRWVANGYRLPTEAEWEKAARGGAAGRRFPWSDQDTIQHARANYWSSSNYFYDDSPTRGYHPTFSTGSTPYTSPVGFFSPNGYGLCDMAGNVWEWCHDRYSSTYYSTTPYPAPRVNPHGPTSGVYRVLRGGCWNPHHPYHCRVSNRHYDTPDRAGNYVGFRCVADAIQLPPYSLQVTVEGEGSVAVDPPGGEYGVTTQVILTAKPEPGWMFVGWDDDLTGDDNPTVIVMDSNKAVIALFELEVIPPPGMVLIPAGEFMMGDAFDGEGDSDELPRHAVWVDAFYMDRYEVTKDLWDTVRAWGLSSGYVDIGPGIGSGSNYPVHSVNWYECVKWCNARSQMEGRTPCYYTDAGLATVYKTGQLAPHVKWGANGYRLPTEAEWEKAARGGDSGQRFPWTDSDTIQHSRANYYSSASFFYDTSPTRNYYPLWGAEGTSSASPVGFFDGSLRYKADFNWPGGATSYQTANGANGFGLYDMAGNVWEWCNDWYHSSYYSNSPYNNPTGPASGSHRVFRGGGWGSYAYGCRVTDRLLCTPDYLDIYSGFRCAAAAP